jgi:uroporphyrinogen-III decarboxylase
MVEGGGSKMFAQIKTWIYKYPKESKELLQKLAEVCVEYLALQVEAGAQVCIRLQVRVNYYSMISARAGLRFVGW